MTRFQKIALSAMALMGSTTSCDTVWAQGRSETIAQTGQAATDGNGTLSSFGTPALNGSGAVMFNSTLTGTTAGAGDDSSIFRGTGTSLTQIAREGQSAPDGNGALSTLQNSSMNNSGATAFSSTLIGTSGGSLDNQGIFRGAGSSLTQIVRKGQVTPVGGTFLVLGSPVLNDSGGGQVAFEAELTGTSGGAGDKGIFRGTGGSLTQIARRGQLAPGNGNFFDFVNLLALNNSGAVAFRASVAVAGLPEGIFRGDGSSLTQIARQGQAVPGGNGVLFDFGISTSAHALNDSGEVAFSAILSATSGGTADNEGIFRGDGGSLTQIARKGQAAPGGNGTLSTLFSPRMNNLGEVAFLANLTGTPDNSGIFRGDGVSLTEIARKGQLAPDGNGTLGLLGFPQLIDSGAAAFNSNVTGTSGGTADDFGIFVSDGIDLLQVVREGDSMSGSTVTEAGRGLDSINSRGQVVYRATLADGTESIQRWTPDLHWRGTTSGSWDTDSRWTLGLNPDLVHDVYIDPRFSLTVNGPAANTTVRSLQIGGSTGNATLNLNNGVFLNATNGVEIAPNGKLLARGIVTGNVANAGIIEVNSTDDAFFADNLAQNGTLQVASGGRAEIHGAFSGNGGFVGGGTVLAAGELSPGNSAASVLYNGNLLMGTNTDTLIELGGLGLGQFDQLRVTGNLGITGDLTVSLIDGHVMGASQQYLIGNIGGQRTGQFNGLGEGALVGVFSGYQTFITYRAGNGNDIALVTAIPEPGTPVLFGLLSIFVASRRQRRREA